MKRRKDKIRLTSTNNKNKKVFGLVIGAIAISGILAIVLPSVGHNVNNNNDQAVKVLLIKEIVILK